MPEVLAWARESAGLSQEDLSRKIRSGELDLKEWERPDSITLVTASQLEKIADAVKRPTAVLLLTSPPKEPPPPKDFRRAQRRPDRHSPDLISAIRRARRLQSAAAEVFRTLEEPVESDLPTTFTLNDDPEQVATGVRSMLRIPSEIHTRWKSAYAALRAWRSTIEDRNVLVFSSDFPRDEAQGFSLSDAEPSVIVLSAKDPPTARCFTLWHEFGHLLLRDVGLCIIDDPSDRSLRSDRAVEDWCHRFAEAVLVDRSLLRSQQQTAMVENLQSGHEAALRSLANYFKVSQHVVLFRMLHLEIIPRERFRSEFDRVMKEQSQAARERDEARRNNPNSRGGRNVPNLVVRESGQRLARSLLQAFDRGVLTHADIADYFGARLKHLDNIRREAHRQEVDS